jgi:hypothetical protein
VILRWIQFLQSGMMELHMDKKQANNTFSVEAEKIILEIIQKNKPETTRQLIKLIQRKMPISLEQTTSLLIQLEKENKLQFAQISPQISKTLLDFILSKPALWYLFTITLSLVTTAVVFIIPENAYPTAYIRLALGLLFVLFLPGYSFIRMLYQSKVPKKNRGADLNNIERVVLSLVMSLALVPLVVLLFNFSPLGVRLTTLTLSLLGLTTVFATIAMILEYKTKIKPTK